MTRNEITYFVLLSFLLELCTGDMTEFSEVSGDEGSDVTLPCGEAAETEVVMWRMQGRDLERTGHRSILSNNSLLLTGLSRDDAGLYICKAEDSRGVLARLHLRVNTPPPALKNVTVVPGSVLAFLHWEVGDNGGYPITHFTAQYRLKHIGPGGVPDIWHPVVPLQISPSATQIDIYQLEPNSSYVFQIWANNQLGQGEIVELEAMTEHDPQEIELAKHLLEGAETFDTRVWVAAVAVVMGTLIVLGTATIYILYKESHLSSGCEKESEALELIPNIILNPGYEEGYSTSYSDLSFSHSTAGTSSSALPDGNSNVSTPFRINNNTVLRPIRI